MNLSIEIVALILIIEIAHW